jgi:hypothetical protein
MKKFISVLLTAVIALTLTVRGTVEVQGTLETLLSVIREVFSEECTECHTDKQWNITQLLINGDVATTLSLSI